MRKHFEEFNDIRNQALEKTPVENYETLKVVKIDHSLHEALKRFWDSLSIFERVNLTSRNLDRVMALLNYGMSKMAQRMEQAKSKCLSLTEKKILSKIHFKRGIVPFSNGVLQATQFFTIKDKEEPNSMFFINRIDEKPKQAQGQFKLIKDLFVDETEIEEIQKAHKHDPSLLDAFQIIKKDFFKCPAGMLKKGFFIGDLNSLNVWGAFNYMNSRKLCFKDMVLMTYDMYDSYIENVHDMFKTLLKKIESQNLLTNFWSCNLNVVLFSAIMENNLVLEFLRRRLPGPKAISEQQCFSEDEVEDIDEWWDVNSDPGLGGDKEQEAHCRSIEEPVRALAVRFEGKNKQEEATNGLDLGGEGVGIEGQKLAGNESGGYPRPQEEQSIEAYNQQQYQKAKANESEISFYSQQETQMVTINFQEYEDLLESTLEYEKMLDQSRVEPPNPALILPLEWEEQRVEQLENNISISMEPPKGTYPTQHRRNPQMGQFNGRRVSKARRLKPKKVVWRDYVLNSYTTEELAGNNYGDQVILSTLKRSMETALQIKNAVKEQQRWKQGPLTLEAYQQHNELQKTSAQSFVKDIDRIQDTYLEAKGESSGGSSSISKTLQSSMSQSGVFSEATDSIIGAPREDSEFFLKKKKKKKRSNRRRKGKKKLQRQAGYHYQGSSTSFVGNLEF